MSEPPNDQPFLLNPRAPAGLTRYAHARLIPPCSKTTLYISGIAAIAPDGELGGVATHPDGSWTADIRAQTAAVLRRIEGIIRGASGGGADLYNIVDAVVYLTDIKGQYTEAPARATVGVRELPDERFLVEIKATAVF
ncbi:Endoribonuclease L-PSP/chorismate mutase-like protein [Aspergillus desertorum]